MTTCKVITNLHGYDVICQGYESTALAIPLYLIFVCTVLILLHHMFVHHVRNITTYRRRNEVYDPASANEYIPLV